MACADGEVDENGEDTAWVATFKNLPKYEDGEEIQYTVTEVETEVITGTDGPGTYAYAVTGTLADGYTITNDLYYYTFRLDMNYNYVLVSKTYKSKYYRKGKFGKSSTNINKRK